MKKLALMFWGISILWFALSAASLNAQQNRSGPWAMQVSGTTAGLRGIHAVGGGVAWASGTDGTVLRTEDGGYMWQRCAMPPGAQKLDFRGIWAWDENTAVVMSSGPSDQSRIYKTVDGCSHWKLVFTNPDKDGFWDAMVFGDRSHGYLLGDPVSGRFVFLTTKDGGESWTSSKAAGLEANNGATGAFAASNSSLLAGPREPVLFGTGAGYIYSLETVGTISFRTPPGTRIKMHEQWTRSATPLQASGDSSGIFSLGYDAGALPGYGYTLVAVGGDYRKPGETAQTAAWSADRQHWRAATHPPHGYRSAVAWDPDAKAWIAAGTNGSDISYDDGKTWTPLDNGNWNALSLPWVVGPGGRIAKLGKLPPR
jgi:photosystem II stability/assembly factor-like uncharacterized protein